MKYPDFYTLVWVKFQKTLDPTISITQPEAICQKFKTQAQAEITLTTSELSEFKKLFQSH